jgi:mono/diheme cytochrome c family protein
LANEKGNVRVWDQSEAFVSTFRHVIVAVALGAAGSVAAFAETAPASFTIEQAERGKAAYEHSCQTCHGANLDDGDFGGAPLRGSWFKTHWGTGDAGALFLYMKTLMPPDNPGGINDAVYADILAFILRGNGYAPGTKELPANADALQKLDLSRGD